MMVFPLNVVVVDQLSWWSPGEAGVLVLRY